MARGKTVQLFLMNGTASGPKKATIAIGRALSRVK